LVLPNFLAELSTGISTVRRRFCGQYLNQTEEHKDDERNGAFNAHGHIRNAYGILVRKSKGIKQCGRCRHTWQHNIKADML
jgi:hypothetical protein